ncbi:MAG: GAF domain-containing protein [Myxococcales bacterium]
MSRNPVASERSVAEVVVDQLPLAACVLDETRIVAANERLCSLLGLPREKIVGVSDALQTVLIPVSRKAGAAERAVDEMDLVGRGSDGAPIPLRGKISPFPLAGPGAVLIVCTDERGLARTAQIVRGLVDAAVAAQREQTTTGLFRSVRDRLAQLGLLVNFNEISGQTVHTLDLGDDHGSVNALRQRWAHEIPVEAFRALLPRKGHASQGNLIEDLPGLIAKAQGKRRDEVDPTIPSRAIYAIIPVSGDGPSYALSATGAGLDATVASAFGLFGQQVGAFLEQIRRIEELDRKNRELAAVNEVARASAALGSADSLRQALERFAEVAGVERTAILRREEDSLELAAQRGFEGHEFAALLQSVAIDRELPWTDAALAGDPVLFTLTPDGSVRSASLRLQTPPGGVLPLGRGQRQGEHNGVVLPLKVGERVHGVLVAVKHDTLEREDLRLLSTLAAQLAVSLLNVMLFQQTQRRVEELSNLLELGQTALGNFDLHRILEAGARVAVRILRCTASYIWLPDPTGTMLRMEAFHDPDVPEGGAEGLVLPLSRRSMMTLAFATRQPQAALDAQSDVCIDRDLVQRFPARSVLAVPLVSHDVSVGALALLTRGDRIFGAQDVRLATHVAQLLSAAVVSSDIVARERRRADELALLQQISTALAGRLDRQELFVSALSRALQLFDADVAAVYERDGDELKLSFTQSKDGIAVGFPEHAPKGCCDGSAETTAQLGTMKLPPESGVRHSLCAPMPGPGASPGGVFCLARRSERAFSPDEARIAHALAAQLSVALSNARLYASEVARAEEMTLLFELSRSVAGSLEIIPLLQAAGERLRKLVDASNWFVLLLDPSKKTLRSIACSPQHAEFMRDVVLHVGEQSLAVECVRTRRPVQETHADGSPRANPRLVRHFGQLALLAIPLIARDEVLGAVMLDDVREPRVFSDAEIKRVVAGAQQIALAVLSARLFEDLRRSYAELARTQASLIERERLAALGELSASIAHEVRNPLGVIFNSIGSLRRLVEPRGDVKLLLDIIGEESERLNHMVGDLLDYSRPIQPALQPVALAPLFDEAVASVRTSVQSDGIDVHVSIAPSVATVRADARLLRQALVNLITNAFQAMPRGGSLTVSATDVLADGGQLARISVRDTGVGIPRDDRERVFHAFFTTKPTGTGLGLAVVRRIAEGHGGRVQLAEVEPGAEFQLFLPM